jgi:hypothetical protein
MRKIGFCIHHAGYTLMPCECLAVIKSHRFTLCRWLYHAISVQFTGDGQIRNTDRFGRIAPMINDTGGVKSLRQYS